MFDPTVSLSRRRLVEVGAGGYLGLNLGGLLRAEAAAPVRAERGTIRACIFVFLYGGPSHIDTFDPKPDAPAEVRGDFKPIATSAPGVRVSEHLPRLSKLMHKAAIVRSAHHAARLHDSGSIHVLTGRPLEGPDRELFAPLPQQYPSYGSAVAALGPGRSAEVPFAALPFVFHNVVPTPAQGGGFLGSAFDPLCIDVDPAARKYVAEPLRPSADLDARRVRARGELLAALQKKNGTDPLEAVRERAARLLTNEAVRAALDIEKEAPRVRDRYGYGPGEPGFASNMRGQNYLMARRLVEAGVPFVNVYDFRQQGQNWDAHANGSDQHKRLLIPPFDQGLSALIEDLDARGLLDSTLVVACGEFGRTPKINGGAGRDHWPDCYSVLLAGGGVKGGAVFGASDKLGAFPATDPVTPGDIAATIFWRFGIDPETEMRDQLNRPHRLAAGDPITKLFAG